MYQTRNMPGFQRRLKVVDSNDAVRLHCARYELLLRDPVQNMTTGELFCRSCTYPEEENDFRPDKAIEREIMELQVSCSHNDCSWEGTQKDVEGHFRHHHENLPRGEVCIYSVAPTLGLIGGAKRNTLTMCRRNKLGEEDSEAQCSIEGASEKQFSTQGYFEFLDSTFLLTLSYFLTKLKNVEDENTRLTALLNKRTQQLKTVMEKTHLLAEKVEVNEQQLEVQKNELKHQQLALQETNILLGRKQLRPFLSDIPGSSRPLWVFRKHQRNLVMVTRPHIQKIFQGAVEAGFVSEIVGKCSMNCSIEDHDCVDGFYKALMVKISEMPEVFELFLQLVQHRLSDSQPCYELCSKILSEVHM